MGLLILGGLALVLFSFIVRGRRSGSVYRSNGGKMTKRPRPAGSNFSKREIVLFLLVVLVATFVTIEGTFFVLKTLVIGSPNDPLTKAGGLSPFQEREVRKGK